MSASSGLLILQRANGVNIAYHALAGVKPGIVFLGGFMSDMTGTKATALQTHCAQYRRAFVKFDYRGHGESSGLFQDGTIGLWLDDALAVIDQIADGPVILVGSSMGGWIALLAALARPDRVKGIVGLAAAPDFTNDIWTSLSEAQKTAMRRDGSIEQPSDYADEPYVITRALIEDGANHCILNAPIPIRCPVRLIQGMKDADVPWSTAFRLIERLESDDATVTLVKSGDHRLSAPEDLKRMTDTVDALCAQVGS
jgi:pimeloyl-ACP methyl ester carboxylesterase